MLYAVDGFSQKSGEVIWDVGILDGCYINWLFPCMGGVLLAWRGWMLEFVQGLSEVAGNQDVAHTAAVVSCNGEATV